MKIIRNQYFKYDGIIFVDEKINEYFDELALIKKKKLKYLAIFLDDRNYSLKEKNKIKYFLDKLDIDILLYTLKPSYLKILNKKFDDFNKTRNIFRLNWILNCLQIYKVKNLYLNKNIFYGFNFDFKNKINLLIELKKKINLLIIGLLNNKKKYSLKNLVFLNLINHLDNKKFSKFNFFILNKTKIKKKITFSNQINKLEKNLFWLGFDRNFKDIPWSKKYKETNWNKKFKKNKLLYEDKIKYCTRCCLPETMEGITFDEFGVCTPCRSSEEKMHISWKDKEKNLRKILNKFKNKNYYDCLLPISGGKDSTFQTYVLTKIYNMTPIAVTHGTNWMSLNGRYNLENCINTFDLDHLFFLPNRNIVNRVAKKSAEFIGDACWHCHIGTQTFPIQTAINWQIPLMIYGESIAERDGRGSYKKLLDHNKKYFYGLKVSAKVRSKKFIGDGIEYSELKKWNYPKKKEMENSKLVYLHLGDYIFWDEQKQTEFIINNFNWKMNNRVENTYKGFKSNECIMAGVHDYFNFIKRGVGRATLHASDDVRRGLIKRTEAKNLIKKYDPERPHALDYYLKITGYKENEIEKKIIDSRKLSKFASKLNKI